MSIAKWTVYDGGKEGQHITASLLIEVLRHYCTVSKPFQPVEKSLVELLRENKSLMAESLDTIPNVV
ncbi:MAG: hypothetical protein ACJ8CB_11430 [Ktedonobacteraceae bacterium]